MITITKSSNKKWTIWTSQQKVDSSQKRLNTPCQIYTDVGFYI